MIPQKVVILGLPFDVVVASLEDETDAGSNTPSARLIEVSDALPASTQVETFYHEVAHVMLALTGYAHILDEKLEEGIAQSLGICIAQMITHNQGLPTLPEKSE